MGDYWGCPHMGAAIFESQLEDCEFRRPQRAFQLKLPPLEFRVWAERSVWRQRSCQELKRSDQTYGFQPEAVQVKSPLLLVERDQPAPATLVPLVLPHRLDFVLQHECTLSMRQSLKTPGRALPTGGVSAITQRFFSRTLHKCLMD